MALPAKSIRNGESLPPCPSSPAAGALGRAENPLGAGGISVVLPDACGCVGKARLCVHTQAVRLLFHESVAERQWG